MKYIKLKKVNENLYIVLFETKTIGDFTRDVDGYFYFFTDGNNGGWSDYVLLEIGNTLKKLNKSWNDKVKKLL